MSNEISIDSDFVAVRIQRAYPAKIIDIDWKQPESISVSITRTTERPAAVWHREWVPELSSAGDAQRLLASESLCLPSGHGDNRLLIAHAGGAREGVWLTETEEAELASLRDALFRAGRIAYLEALMQLRIGHDILVTGRVEESMPVFRLGIEVLGFSYHARGVLDDSGQALTCSKYEQRQGHLDVAARLLESVLESRTTQYAEREGLPVEHVR